MVKINGYSATGSISCYATKNALKTNSNQFTIPTLELANEKSTQKIEIQKNEAKQIGFLTFIGYDKFDPFKDMAKTGCFRIPKYMQTKTEPTRSDAEILKDMEELAKEHARTGISRREDDERFIKLLDEYISSVSPDRVGILESKISEILERMKEEIYGVEDLKDKDSEKEPIDYFIEMLKNKEKAKDSDIINSNIATRGNSVAIGGNIYSNNNIIASRTDGYYTQIDIDCGGGKITSLTYDINGALLPHIGMKGDMYDNVLIENNEVRYANFYDSNGEKIMSYDSNNFGLLQKYTEAESARLKEMISAYNSAYEKLNKVA